MINFLYGSDACIELCPGASAKGRVQLEAFGHTKQERCLLKTSSPGQLSKIASSMTKL